MAKGVPAVWEGEGVNSGTGRAYGDGDGAGADCGNAVADALKLRASVCCRCSVAVGSQNITPFPDLKFELRTRQEAKNTLNTCTPLQESEPKTTGEK
uniref:Uncharacterized protein n=2 Tax=Oryza TaxID=4527 RepID=A0A0D3G8Y1_9ORYZ